MPIDSDGYEYMAQAKNAATPSSEWISVKEFSERTGTPKSSTHVLIRNKRLRTTKFGRRRLIDYNAYVKALEDAAA